MMKESITPRRLLGNIKKSLFDDTPIAQVVQTPLPELMEQMLDSGYSKDSLGWLYEQFWEDETGQTPQPGTPLVDDHGRLWSREDFGQDLTDEEYDMVKHLYALADWARSLYHTRPFDLRIIMPEYESKQGESKTQLGDDAAKCYRADFVYPNEALYQWTQETPLQRLAALTTHILLSCEFEKDSAWDQPIQDYYAEHCEKPHWSDAAECEDFTKRAWEAMQTIADHCAKGAALGLTHEQQNVVDALWSWVPHDFDADVVAAGREICQQADALMPDPLTIRSDQGSRAYINKVWPEIKRIAQEHDVYLDTDDGYSLTMGYLTHWLDNKYWYGRRPEDD